MGEVLRLLPYVPEASAQRRKMFGGKMSEMLCEAKAKADTPSVVTTPKMETSKNKEEELQLRRKIERLKQDLERYATSFEAGYLQRRSEEEAKDMMEKISTLKEYEKKRTQAQRGGGEENANGEIQTEGVAASKEIQGLKDASRVLNLDVGRASQGNKPDGTL